MNPTREGLEIRHRRHALGWTAKRLCREIRLVAVELGQPEPGVNPQTISRWERGKLRVSDRYRHLLDEVWRRTLGAEHATEGRDAMRRRDFLAQAAFAGSGVLLPTPAAGHTDAVAELATALAGRGRPDLAMAHALETTTTRLSEMFTDTPSAVLAPLVDAHLANIAGLLDDSGLQANVRRLLASSAAETAILSGWIANDAGDEDTAERRYLTGLDAAEVAGDKAIGAYGLASVALLGPWRRTSADSVDLLTTGEVRGFRPNDASPLTRAWIHVLAAEAAVRGRQLGVAQRLLDKAANGLEGGDDGSPRPRALFFTIDRLDGERGVLAQRAGAHNDAIEALTAAAAAHAGARIASRYHLSIAESRLALGELDGAVASAARAADTAITFASETDTDQVLRFRAKLPDSVAIAPLDDALAVAG